MVGPSNALQEDGELASLWSDPVAIGAITDGKLSCFFNRGIVASQWLARLLPSDSDPKKDATAKGAKLTKIIANPGDPTRNFLAGPLREKLVALLNDAKNFEGACLRRVVRTR
jgi:hypothetical protein